MPSGPRGSHTIPVVVRGLIIRDQEIISISRRSFGSNAFVIFQEQEQRDDGYADGERDDTEQTKCGQEGLVGVLMATDFVVDS